MRTVCLFVFVLAGAAAAGPTVHVRDAAELRTALVRAKAGTTILLAPGTYAGGFSARGLTGTARRPIVIASADPKQPAVLADATTCLHLASVAHLELRDLVVKNARANGINLDDGGTITRPSHHVRLIRITVRDVGPDGNRDGIKLSGLDDFRVEDCVLENWGRGGSAIDMVGCHNGEITGCTFRRGGASGVQCKGGSRGITIRRCRFEDAGGRAVNLGGSTGRAYFRPPNPGYEAKDLTVEDCTFIGSEAPIAFVGVDGAVVRHNTFYRPRRWVLRILQESRGDAFVPCRNGRFTHNLVVFRSDELRRLVNVGAGTQPETFVFERNFWFCIDAPERSRPDLPTVEKRGTYGKNPLFAAAAKGDLRLKPNSPARDVGPR